MLNERFESGHLNIHVVLIPVSRDQLFPALLDGRADIAAANLTITPERLKLVDFSDPLVRNISEVLVTSGGTPPLEGLEDLAGMEIHVRPSSSYSQSLAQLSKRLQKEGEEPIRIHAANELLESEDLLEMVNAAVIPATVVDEGLADFWAQVFPDITVHSESPLREGGTIGWAFRKDSPALKSSLAEFVREHRQGTLIGNITPAEIKPDGSPGRPDKRYRFAQIPRRRGRSNV